MADQESVHHMDNDVTSTDALHKTYTVDEFEVRILELKKPGGHWETKSTIPMQLFENALTVRIVTLHVCVFSHSHLKPNYMNFCDKPSEPVWLKTPYFSNPQAHFCKLNALYTLYLTLYNSIMELLA